MENAMNDEQRRESGRTARRRGTASQESRDLRDRDTSDGAMTQARSRDTDASRR